MSRMLGACCTCQESHPVRSASRSMIDHDAGKAGRYVMDSHDPSFGGGPCEGFGTTPQAVFEDTTTTDAPPIKKPAPVVVRAPTKTERPNKGFSSLADAFARAGNKSKS